MHGISKRTGVARAQLDWAESLPFYPNLLRSRKSVWTRDLQKRAVPMVLVEESDGLKIADVVEKHQVSKITGSGQSYCDVVPWPGNCKPASSSRNSKSQRG
jgi:hypothetical protein